MKTHSHLFSSFIAGVLLLMLSVNLFGQSDEGKSKLDIIIDNNGEKIQIDTLIDTSQLPKLFDELNKQMPVLENFMESLSGEELDFNFDTKAFENFFNEDFIQSFEGMFKNLEQLNAESFDLNNSLKQIEEMFKGFEGLEGFENFEGFGDLPELDFNFDALNPRPKVQLGLILSEKAENGNTEITVNEVVKGSIAEKAGLLKGDKILKIDGQKAAHISDISNAVQRKKDKEFMQINIERNGITTTLNVQIDVPKPDKVKEKVKKV